MAKKKKYEYKFRLTLTEVIVAVSIFALLTLVSLFAYNQFMMKANNSKALAECKQAQEGMLSNLLSAKGDAIYVNCDGITFSYDLSKGKIVFSGSIETNDECETFSKEMKEKFSELSEIEGSFSIVGKTITYTTKDGRGQAIWQSGQLPISIEEYNTK